MDLQAVRRGIIYAAFDDDIVDTWWVSCVLVVLLEGSEGEFANRWVPYQVVCEDWLRVGVDGTFLYDIDNIIEEFTLCGSDLKWLHRESNSRCVVCLN